MVARFDRERFKELVLYIAWQVKDDPSFGRVKLAKALFYSDFEAYAGTGEPLTGARYEHWKRGPFPPVLYDVERELEAQQLAAIKRSEQKGDEEKLLPFQEPIPLLHERWQLELARIQVRKVEAEPSWKVSDISHEHPGWLVTSERQEIPLHAVHISRQGPSEYDLAEAEAVAREHGWI